MTGPMGGGSPDKPKQPKPPDKPPVSPDAQKPQGDNRAADKVPPPGQPDGKGAKDNQGPGGPQGGKPVEVPTKSGDAGPRQSGDSPAKQGGDQGPRAPGDAPAKQGDGPVKLVDGPHQPADQHPGWHQSADFGQWTAQVQAQWQPRPDSRPATGPTDAKGGQHDQRYEKFTHRIDLDDCRGDNGKFDRDKLKAKLEGFVQADQLDRTKARLHVGSDGRQHHGAVSTRPMELTVRVEHARSWVDVREVSRAMHEVADKYRVHGRIEVPGRPPEAVRPGPMIRPEAKPGGDRQHPGLGGVEIHRPQDGTRPAVRPVPQPTPQLPNGGRNFQHGR